MEFPRVLYCSDNREDDLKVYADGDVFNNLGVFTCCNPVASLDEVIEEIRSDYLFEYQREIPNYKER